MGVGSSRVWQRYPSAEVLSAVFRLPQITDRCSAKDLRSLACASRECLDVVSHEEVWRVKVAERLAVPPAQLPLPPARRELNGWLLGSRMPRQPPRFFEMAQALTLYEHFLRFPEHSYRPTHCDLQRSDALFEYLFDNFLEALEVGSSITEGFRIEMFRHAQARKDIGYADAWGIARIILLGSSDSILAGLGAYAARNATCSGASRLGTMGALGPLGLKVMALTLLLDAGLIALDISRQTHVEMCRRDQRHRDEQQLHRVRLEAFALPQAVAGRREELRQPQLQESIIAMLQRLELEDAGV